MRPQKYLKTLCHIGCAVFFIGCVICIISALESINQSESEIADRLDGELPFNAFVTYERIGHEYGVWAAWYWRAKFFDYDFLHANEVFQSSESAKIQINEANKNNFYVPPDERRDEEIMQRYKGLQSRYPELLRLNSYNERFKDMMAYIGGAAVLGFLCFICWQVVKKDYI